VSAEDVRVMRHFIDHTPYRGSTTRAIEAHEALTRFEVRLAKAERERDEAGAGLVKCNEKLRGHQASIERRKHNAAEQEARLARLKRAINDFHRSGHAADWSRVRALAATEEGAEA